MLDEQLCGLLVASKIVLTVIQDAFLSAFLVFVIFLVDWLQDGMSVFSVEILTIMTSMSVFSVEILTIMAVNKVTSYDAATDICRMRQVKWIHSCHMCQKAGVLLTVSIFTGKFYLQHGYVNIIRVFRLFKCCVGPGSYRILA